MTNHDAERKRIESLIYSFAASAPEPVNLASEAARRMLADHIYGNWAQVQMERERRLVAVIREGMERSLIPAYEGSYCIFCDWNNSDGHAADCPGAVVLVALAEKEATL